MITPGDNGHRPPKMKGNRFNRIGQLIRIAKFSMGSYRIVYSRQHRGSAQNTRLVQFHNQGTQNRHRCQDQLVASNLGGAGHRGGSITGIKRPFIRLSDHRHEHRHSPPSRNPRRKSVELRAPQRSPWARASRVCDRAEGPRTLLARPDKKQR